MTERHLFSLSRRTLLQGAGTAGMMLPFGRLKAAEGSKHVKFAWNANAICLAPIAVAVNHGLFAKHNLDVELVNYSGSTDQLLESLATGKADAAVGMALRWLKPLEQGFDVRLIAGLHGGCLHLLAAKSAGIGDLQGLRGKTIAVSDMASPAKNFFSVLLAKRGIDPNKDVEWRQYPSNLLATAVEKGEAQALADSDPLTYGFLKGGGFTELATNLVEEYHHRLCCIIGVRGSLLRDDRPTATALTRALLEAQDITARQPEVAAQAFATFSPHVSVEDFTAMLKGHTHGEHALGADLRQQIVAYAEELKFVSVLKPSTDPVKFAEKITADIVV